MTPSPKSSSPTSVPLPSPLFAARFLRRPNRFVVHAQLDMQEVVCHLPDPGRLRELLLPGRRLLLRHAPSPSRKTAWSVVLVEAPQGEGWLSVDTTLPNRLVAAALLDQALEEFRGWRMERREYTHGRSRLDFMLSNDEEKMALEVKSVTLVEDGKGLFPDAVTARGARHMEELAEIACSDGWRAAALFVLQRNDAASIQAARTIDPRFADSLVRARRAGVEVLGRRCRVGRERVVLCERVPVLSAGS